MVGNKGYHDQDEEVQAAHQKPPQEFLAPFPFSGQETGQEGDDYVDADDADGHNLFRQAEAVEEQGQQKEQSGGEEIGDEQTFQYKCDSRAQIKFF